MHSNFLSGFQQFDFSMDFVVFILLGIHLAFCTCKFLSFIQFGEIFYSTFFPASFSFFSQLGVLFVSMLDCLISCCGSLRLCSFFKKSCFFVFHLGWFLLLYLQVHFFPLCNLAVKSTQWDFFSEILIFRCRISIWFFSSAEIFYLTREIFIHWKHVLFCFMEDSFHGYFQILFCQFQHLIHLRIGL